VIFHGGLKRPSIAVEGRYKCGATYGSSSLRGS
jgi:hypothetical protein